jgi:hypothetical protein
MMARSTKNWLPSQFFTTEFGRRANSVFVWTEDVAGRAVGADSAARLEVAERQRYAPVRVEAADVVARFDPAQLPKSAAADARGLKRGRHGLEIDYALRQSHVERITSEARQASTHEDGTAIIERY